jgi:hypothetical protein
MLDRNALFRSMLPRILLGLLVAAALVGLLYFVVTR